MNGVRPPEMLQVRGEVEVLADDELKKRARRGVALELHRYLGVQ